MRVRVERPCPKLWSVRVWTNFVARCRAVIVCCVLVVFCVFCRSGGGRRGAIAFRL